MGFLLGRIHSDDRSDARAALAAATDPHAGGQYRSRSRIVRPDGTVRWVEAMGIAAFEPTPAGPRHAVRLVGTVWDVTEHERSVQALRDTIRRKDRILAMSAHELRGPLVPLVNAHRLLARSAVLGRSERSVLELADRQASQLARLVDDLMDASRAQRGRIELRPEPVTVQTAVYNAVESVGAAIESRGQTLRVELPAEPSRIRADSGRLAQILTNLLGNASKYTHEGGAIRVRVADCADGVEIRVSDDGIGIEPDKLPAIFELFAQVDATLDRAQGGLGIGLALVRELTELHGGSVAAESAGRGCGATFTVRLPRGGPARATGSQSARDA